MASADNQATFAINLEDGTTGAAQSAAAALTNLKRTIDADTKALAEMKKAMRNLQGGTSVNVQQFRELKAKIDAKKQSIASAQSAYIDLGGQFKKTSSGARFTGASFGQLSSAAASAGGPLGSLAARMGGISAILGAGALAAGILAVAAAYVALSVAAVAAAVSLGKYGIASADARRSELIRLEGLTKIRNWYGLAAGNAQEMQDAVDRVSGSVSLGRGKIAEYSSQLYRMGLRGENLSQALAGVSITAAVQGDAQAKRFAGWAAGANMAGKSVKALADDVRARLGGLAARQMLALDVQSNKLHEDFASLFNGLRIEGFLSALRMSTELLSQSTATGRALRSILEAAFAPVGRVLEWAGPIAKRFFQGMTIGALMLTIAMLKVRNWFRDTFGDSEILRSINAQGLALKAGGIVVALLAGAFGALALAVGLAVAPFALLGASMVATYKIWTGIYSFFADTDWSTIGAGIVDGIVDGLRNGTKRLIDATKGLAKGAWETFRGALGIASPSKAFARLGLSISQGVEQGVDTGAPAAQRAVAGVVPAPNAADGAGGVNSRSSASITIGEIHVHASGGSAEELGDAFRRKLEDILEGVAVTMGARPVGGV